MIHLSFHFLVAAFAILRLLAALRGYFFQPFFCWQGASCGPREFAAAPRCSLGMVRGRSAVSWRGLSVLGYSCGHPELPRRDADEALEVMRELALVREAGGGGDFRQGEIAFAQELLRPFNAAGDDVLVRAKGTSWIAGRTSRCT